MVRWILYNINEINKTKGEMLKCVKNANTMKKK